jgi:hypothetical protein
MKYTLTNKTVTILEHIIFVSEKTSKTVQFCFIKGKKQYYINPLQDIFVTFELDEAIKFDYGISNLKTFLGRAVKVLDSDKNKTNKDDLFLPTKEHIRNFESKSVVQTIDFKLNDLKQVSKFKYRYINIIGDNNKFILRYQNHVNNWWFDDGDKKTFNIGKSTRKFRYVIKRERLKLLPNDYKLICKEGGVLRFQLKHLNYYFQSENSWQRQQVKTWVTVNDRVKDKHLIALYKSKGYM